MTCKGCGAAPPKGVPHVIMSRPWDGKPEKITSAPGEIISYEGDCSITPTKIIVDAAWVCSYCGRVNE